MVPICKAFVAFLSVTVCYAYSTVRVTSSNKNWHTGPESNFDLHSHVRSGDIGWGKASILGETKGTSASRAAAQQFSRNRDMELTLSLMNDVFQLTESVDDEEITSIVEFTDSGEMVFLKPSAEEVRKISGAWNVNDGALNLVISRTHSSKFAEFTVKKQLYGHIEEAVSTLSAVGKIFCDDLRGDLNEAVSCSDTSGTFSLCPIDVHRASKCVDAGEIMCA